ncbi:MAG: lipid A deacylase LpxR family protein, partial [Gammaproteobacteria bacterium]
MFPRNHVLPGIIRFLFLAGLAGFSINAPAAKPPSESWTVTFRFENDLFNDSDRFYTNGIKLNWISPELQWFEDLDWFQREGLAQDTVKSFISVLPYREDESRLRNFSFSIGQMMYTPRDMVSTELVVDDRPYAGWLYGSVAFHSKNYRVLDTFEIQAGMTGKWSLARQTQNLVHSLRNIPRARGWDNQIATEPGIVLVYDHKYRLVPRINFSRRWKADAILHMGGALGNINTKVNGGIEFRAGWNLPADFGTALIRPGGDTNAPADTMDVRYEDESGYSAHVFMAAIGRVVLRNIFLDGNTFTDSHSVDKKTLVGDFVIGASVVYRRLKFSYAHVFRSNEFK